MSLSNVKYLRPLPWQDGISLTGAGVYWEWIVQRGRGYGKQLGSDYIEVHFEDLVAAPQETLNTIGRFIDQELDHDRILEVGYGSVSKPNTSFRREPQESFNPVGRWKKGFSPEQLLRFECMVGKTLAEVGYEPATNGLQRGMNSEMKTARRLYRSYFEAKLQLKRNPLVRRFRPLTAAHIDATALGEDRAPELRSVVAPQTPRSSR
jgi:hypothetical protein